MTGESRSDKSFSLLKTDMELEVCTSLGSMFPQERCSVSIVEIRPGNDTGNGLAVLVSRPQALCCCSWKLGLVFTKRM